VKLKLFIIYCILGQNDLQDRTKNPLNIKKWCQRNMETLRGCCELYQSENLNNKQKIKIIPTCDSLIKLGFLKSAPKCNKKNDYVFLLGSREAEIDVRCVVHGDLSKQDTLHKTKGVEPEIIKRYNSELIYNKCVKLCVVLFLLSVPGFYCIIIKKISFMEVLNDYFIIILVNVTILLIIILCGYFFHRV